MWVRKGVQYFDPMKYKYKSIVIPLSHNHKKLTTYWKSLKRSIFVEEKSNAYEWKARLILIPHNTSKYGTYSYRGNREIYLVCVSRARVSMWHPTKLARGGGASFSPLSCCSCFCFLLLSLEDYGSGAQCPLFAPFLPPFRRRQIARGWICGLVTTRVVTMSQQNHPPCHYVTTRVVTL